MSAQTRTALAEPVAQADAVVEVRGVGKTYPGPVQALDNINVDFPRGHLT